MAGGDSEQWLKLLMAANHPYILASFYNGLYNHPGTDRWVDWYHRLNKMNANFIMDSGLFTMMFGAGKDKEWKEKDLIKYTHQYLDTMEQIKYDQVVVEMDVQKLLGREVHKKFRKIFEQKWDIEKTIYVWHLNDGFDGWKEICKRYPWVALSIPEMIMSLGKKKADSLMREAIIVAHKINPNIKIHLLGCTQTSLLMRRGYYSCDSTSWLGGARYGSAGHKLFINGKMTSPPNGLTGRSWKPYQKELQKIHRDVYTIVKPKNKNTLYFLYACISIKQHTKQNAFINRKYYNNEPIAKLWN